MSKNMTPERILLERAMTVLQHIDWKDQNKDVAHIAESIKDDYQVFLEEETGGAWH